MKNLLRFSEQKKCVRRGDKASATRLLMRINSREKSLRWWGFNCFASPPPFCRVSLSVFIFPQKSSCFMSLLQSASSGWMITFNTPERQEGDEGREKKNARRQRGQKAARLASRYNILQMYPESRQSDPHWLKKWKYSNNQALCSAQVPAGDRRAYREDEGYLDYIIFIYIRLL